MDLLEQSRRTIFVGSLHPSTVESTIFEYFSTLGEQVEHVKCIRTLSGKSKGFAFVRLRKKEAVESVLGRDDHVIDNSDVSMEKQDTYRKVILKNIPSSIGESQILEHFSSSGEIASVYIPENLKTKERKGHCIVTFASVTEAFEVVKKRKHHI
ncbi:predicted protein, partial [Nematostella vectensis]